MTYRNSAEDYGTYGEEWVREQIAIGEGLPGNPRFQELRSQAEYCQTKGKSLTEYAHIIGWPLAKLGVAIIVIWLLQALQLYAMGDV